tara:strand:+ start:571 stop:744 length:174 start_codon:yes stop_codon:yes gene_type:complete
LKKALKNSFNYRAASIPPKSKFNGFAGEPIITAIVMAMPKTTPTTTNRVFISKVSNA